MHVLEAIIQLFTSGLGAISDGLARFGYYLLLGLVVLILGVWFMV